MTWMAGSPLLNDGPKELYWVGHCQAREYHGKRRDQASPQASDHGTGVNVRLTTLKHLEATLRCREFLFHSHRRAGIASPHHRAPLGGPHPCAQVQTTGRARARLRGDETGPARPDRGAPALRLFVGGRRIGRATLSMGAGLVASAQLKYHRRRLTCKDLQRIGCCRS